MIIAGAAAVIALLVIGIIARPPAPGTTAGDTPTVSGAVPGNAPATAPQPAGNAPVASMPAANAPRKDPGNGSTPIGSKPSPVAPVQPAPKVDPKDLPPGHPAITTDSGNQVTIQWLGYSCFYVQSPGGTAVVTDPFDSKEVGLPAPAIGAHLVTVSAETPEHNFVDAVRTFKDTTVPKQVIHGQPVTRGDVRITPLPTTGDKSGAGANFAYIIEAGGLRIAHLGDIRGPLTTDQVKTLGAVDILMVPVGGEGLSSKDAVKIARQVNPRVVLPMEYSTGDMEGAAGKLRGVQDFVKASPFAVTSKEYDVMLVSKPDLPPSTEIWTLKFRR